MEVRGWKKLKFLSAKKFSRLIVATIARPRQTFVMTTIIQVSLLGTKVTILIGSARCYSNSIPYTVLPGVRSCVSSPFSRCTPILDWSE